MHESLTCYTEIASFSSFVEPVCLLLLEVILALKLDLSRECLLDYSHYEF